ncbi:MAG: HDOD domain-containing protein [Desulfarculaceae bacterium]|nr:HDOD domain-containing protein [Desulfarculaceae bacterium]
MKSSKRKSILEGLTRSQYKSFYDNSDIIEYRADRKVLRQGEPDTRLFIVLTGRFRVMKKEGERTRVRGHVRQGDFFNEDAFIGRKKSSVTIQAAENSCVIRISRAAFNLMDPDIRLYFYRMIARKSVVRADRMERAGFEAESKKQALIDQNHELAVRNAQGIYSCRFLSELVNKVPKLPSYALSLTGKINEGYISPHEIADEIKKHPSLAGILLKTINSSYYGMPGKVGDISYAVMLLGYNAVSQLVIAEGMKKVLPDTPLFRDLYQHSLGISYITYELSKGFRAGKPVMLSTVCILHETGQLVLQLLKDKNPHLKPLFDLIDSAVLGRMLLESWQLPDGICDTVAYLSYPSFSAPDRIPEHIRQNVAVIYMAHLCYDHLNGEEEAGSSDLFYDSYRKTLGIENLRISEVMKKVVIPGMLGKKNLPVFLTEKMNAYIDRNDLIKTFVEYLV